MLLVLLVYTGMQVQILLPGTAAAAWIVTAALFALMLGWQILYRRHAGAVDRRWFHWLAWLGSGCFGVWATFVMFSLPVDAAALLLRLWGGSTAFMPTALRIALAAAALVTAVGLWQTLRGPSLKPVSIPIEGLHEDLEGLTIAQISDLHVGPTIRRRYVARVVRRTLAAAPDLIAITGDLADGSPEGLRRELEPLSQLRAPLGVYYVTGNHEYYWGGQRWVDAVARLGAVPLVGRAMAVPRRGALILVAGVADPAARSFGAAEGAGIAELARCEPAPDLRVLLAHRPGACYAASQAGFDLQLSGHTHGGQFFPFNLVVRLTHRYHRGLVRLGRLRLYVSAGTGYWGPPHRFWVPAEVAVLRLVRAP